MEIQTFSFKKMHLKMLSVKWQSSCLGLNVLGKKNDVDPVNILQGQTGVTDLQG